MTDEENNADSVIQDVARRLKALRVEKGYSSYEKFALDHDLDRKQYWRAENGSNLTLKSLHRILNIHRITLGDFFADFPETQNPGSL
jgi:transcriptional regulator with XRE-family HTH domain